MVYGAAVLVLTGRFCIDILVEVLLVEDYARKTLEKVKYLPNFKPFHRQTRTYSTSLPPNPRPMYIATNPNQTKRKPHPSLLHHSSSSANNPPSLFSDPSKSSTKQLHPAAGILPCARPSCNEPPCLQRWTMWSEEKYEGSLAPTPRTSFFAPSPYNSNIGAPNFLGLPSDPLFAYAEYRKPILNHHRS